MPPLFQQMMNDATRLTRAGKLQAAVAAIRSALSPAGTSVSAGPHGASQAGVIDVAARVVDTPGTADTPDVADEDTPATPERFIAGSFGEGTLQRDYKLYIPPGAGTRPLPLVVMLHGCTQNPDDFAAGTAMNDAARTLGVYVLYPAQSPQANPQRCWNWFKHSHQQRGRGEPQLLAGMTREVMQNHAVDAARVYVAGLSAGGAMAAILADAYPELYAAVGVHSGLATGAASDLPSAFGAMRSGGAARNPAAAVPAGVPTIVFHGDADGTVHSSNGEQVIAASAAGTAGVTVERTEGHVPGGRSYTRALHRSADGQVQAEHWRVHGAPHAWSGGSAAGTYTDPRGPDATAQMLRFFLERPHAAGH